MWYAPIAFITGQTGKNVKALLNHTQNVFAQSISRVPTSELNRLIQKAIERHPPPAYKSRAGKIYYATQVSVQPPTLVVICNQPKAFSTQYRRYLLGVLRDQLDFGEVPIKLYLQKRNKDDQRNDMGVSDAEGDEHESEMLDSDSHLDDSDVAGQHVGDDINVRFDEEDEQ
jgi:GTP-binding protein